MNHFLVFNYDKLVALEAAAWSFARFGSCAAVRLSAEMAYNEIKKAREQKENETVEHTYIDFEAVA